MAELEGILAERRAVLAGLERDVETLERAPFEFDQRLEQLESQFGSVQRGDVLKVKLPLLHDLSKILHDEHALQHIEGVEHACWRHEESCSNKKKPPKGLMQEHFDDNDPGAKQQFVLHHGYVPLDRTVDQKVSIQEAIAAKNWHPAVSDTHYVGHVSRPVHVAEHKFVGAGDQHMRRPLATQQVKEFWLDTRDGWAVGTTAVPRATERATVPQKVVEQRDAKDMRAYLQGLDAGGSEDLLGKMKRGIF